jgi:hypothetical protein
MMQTGLMMFGRMIHGKLLAVATRIHLATYVLLQHVRKEGPIVLDQVFAAACGQGKVTERAHVPGQAIDGRACLSVPTRHPAPVLEHGTQFPGHLDNIVIQVVKEAAVARGRRHHCAMTCLWVYRLVEDVRHLVRALLCEEPVSLFALSLTCRAEYTACAPLLTGAPLPSTWPHLVAQQGNMAQLAWLLGEHVILPELHPQPLAHRWRYNIHTSKRMDSVQAAVVHGAILGGHVHILDWVEATKGAIHDVTKCLILAAETGHLDTTLWFFERVVIFGDRVDTSRKLVSYVTNAALQYGHVHLMDYFMVHTHVQLTDYLFSRAVEYSQLPMMQWLLDHHCPWNTGIFIVACSYGSEACVTWLLDHRCPTPFTVDYSLSIAKRGFLGTLQRIYANDAWYVGDSHEFMLACIKSGNLACVQWANTRCTQNLTRDMIVDAAIQGSVAIITWLLDQGCPMDLDQTVHMALRNGRTPVLQYLFVQHGSTVFPWSNFRHGNYEYVITQLTLSEARVQFVAWLHDTCKYPLTESLFQTARNLSDVPLLQWLLQHGCKVKPTNPPTVGATRA